MNLTNFILWNLILNTEFQNFIIPGNFQKFSGTLEFLLEMTYFLPNSYRVFSPCNFWPWTWFSILDYTHRETLEFPRISLLLPLSKYRVLFLFSIHPSTRFSIFQSKIPSFLKSSWNYMELWKWHVFCQETLGFPHAIFGPELDFQSWITHIEKP